jgi:ribonuclease Z
MRPLFHPRLINGPFDDPGLYIAFQFTSRAILFDLGDLTSLPARDILKVSHVFVTHTHMDHFVGFDRLLRLHLGRSRALHLYGPPGFCDNVAGKLAGYTWNLVDNYTRPLTLEVNEIGPLGILTRSFRCQRQFRSDPGGHRRPFSGCLLEEPGFSVNAALLDHGVPCLAFALKERFHINIIKNKLDTLGLTTGPWLNEFKQALYSGVDKRSEFSVPAAAAGRASRFAIGKLADQIALLTPGQKIGYITDVADTPANRSGILALAADCDRLFIEAAFLDSDLDLARLKHHLTARQAGELAALAGAKQFTVFHFSPRYSEDSSRLYTEADIAFEAGQEPDRPA